MYTFFMDDAQKMLRAIINGQSTFKQELLSEIKKVDRKVERLDVSFVKLDKKLDKVESNLTGRIDKIGRQLAYLELVVRVDKLEQKVISQHIPGV